MITKQQAMDAFCEHCDDRMAECDGCGLKQIIDAIPDTPCPVCKLIAADPAYQDGVQTYYLSDVDNVIKEALEEVRHD